METPSSSHLLALGSPSAQNSGFDTLAGKCQHLKIVIPNSLGGFQKEGSPFNIEAFRRLDEKLRTDFYGVVSATKRNKYKPLTIKGGNGILIKTLDTNNDQNPTVVNVTISSWFPFSRKKIFKFLGNVSNRTKWDILDLGHKSEEVFKFHSRQGSEDTVSIIKMVDKMGKIDIIFLQEKQQNPIASHIIFSLITSSSLVSLSNQGKIEVIPILSCGFAIISDKYSTQLKECSSSTVIFSEISRGAIQWCQGRLEEGSRRCSIKMQVSSVMQQLEALERNTGDL